MTTGRLDDDCPDDDRPVTDPRFERLLAAAFGHRPRIPSQRAVEILEREGGHWTRVLLEQSANAPDASGGSAHVEMDPEVPFAGRYRILGEVARGGAGVVLRARDTTLGRDVAIKVLHARHGDRPAMIDRFLEEAQIGAQLEHPGIVPVHEIGMLAAGRPFFTMKFVDGRTFAEVLADHRSDRVHLLTIVERVCETMAFAHARGVIHRDLKPSNVLVGAFGDVQVTDWGMAKVLGADTAKDEPTSVDGVATIRSEGDGSSASVAGAVLGTPAYMSPEQARGDVGTLDERSDVFALGVILCEVLIGRPPYAGNRDEIMAMAESCETAGALRELGTIGADPQLVGLIGDCLAADPDRRPATAGAVAERLAAYRTAVERRAEDAVLEKVRAEARAEAERRVRRLHNALWAGATAVALASLGFWLLLDLRRTARMERATARIETAIGEARTLARQAAASGEVTQWESAASAAASAAVLARSSQVEPVALQRAESLLVEVNGALAAARHTAEQQAADGRIRQKLFAIRSEAIVDLDWIAQDRAFGALFAGLGIDPDSMPAAAAAARVRDSRIRGALIEGLDAWSLSRRNLPGADVDAVVAVAQGADDDPLRKSLRGLIVDPDPGRARAATVDLELAAVSPSTVLLACRALRAAGLVESGLELIRRGQLAHPDDIWLCYVLAMESSLAGNHAAAVRYASSALATRPDSVVARVQLGVALARSGSVADAESVLRRAVLLGPEFAAAHINLANVLLVRGDLEQAKMAFARAVAIRADPGWFRGFASNLDRVGDTEGAMAVYRDGLRHVSKDGARWDRLVRLAESFSEFTGRTWLVR